MRTIYEAAVSALIRIYVWNGRKSSQASTKITRIKVKFANSVMKHSTMAFLPLRQGVSRYLNSQTCKTSPIKLLID